MEGSAEDPGEWELADLNDSMFRLMLSSKKSSDSSTPPQSTLVDFVEEAPLLPDSVASSFAFSGLTERRRGPSEEVFSQVDQFLREALEKPRERLWILRMEQDIEKFIRDPTQQELEFKDLPTSYLRLAAHRLAQHFCLQSIAMSDTIMPDGSGSQIVLRKTSDCRFPSTRLADIPVNLPQEDANNVIKVAIKQRIHKESSVISSGNTSSSERNLTKSVLQRKEEYNKARARIFNSSGGGGIAKTEGEANLQDSFQQCFSESARSDEKSTVEQSETNPQRTSSDSFIGSNRSNRNKADKEPSVSKNRTSNRVAIFRDREVDRKDPDYDRSYDRYMQRFDPGFGFSGGPYTMRPMFSPSVNYNTEFPQLGSSHRPQIPIEHQPRHIPQQLQGPWSATSGTSAISYVHPEGMMASFNAKHVGAPSTSSVYMHSPQYSVPPCPGISFAHSHEHVQRFAQTPQQQAEVNSGLARPR